jgi:hypothetical protein
MSDHTEATSGQGAPTAAATTPVTVEQAAAILGVSITTVKRRIRAGSLRAEEARRPQGTVWLVYLPSEATGAATSGQGAASVVATAPTSTPAADAMVSLIQTTIGTVLGPLVAELAASRQTNERQAGQIARQSETIGELRAENRALLASTAPHIAETTTEPPTPLSRLLALWRWLVLVLVVAVTTMLVLLAWPR